MMTTLFDAQRMLLLPSMGAAKRLALLEALKKSVPVALLAHFLRLVSQGRRGVAPVRHGVCSECHIRVPSAIVAALAHPNDVHLCEHCGSYLLLPDDELPPPSPPVLESPKPQRRGRKCRRALAA